KGRVGGAGVPEEQRGPDALRRVSQGGPADHIESHGVDGEDVQLSREGDGEILVRARGRGDASTPRRLPERDRTHGQVLGRSARDGDWAAALPLGRVLKEIANRVVHPPPTFPRCQKVAGPFRSFWSRIRIWGRGFSLAREFPYPRLPI